MSYVAWGALYEGPSDEAYFNVLIPRMMTDLVARFGTRNSTIPLSPATTLTRGSVTHIAEEACRERDAFHLVFIHIDTGGRALEEAVNERKESYAEAMARLCSWPIERCVQIAPRHETEAWVLADRDAVAGALGYRGDLAAIELPAGAPEAERLPDPKATLTQAARLVRGRRSLPPASQLFSAVAQRQRLEQLRRSDSFNQYEADMREALISLGCVHR